MIKLPKTKGEILLNENLAKYSWFQTGGNAEAIFKPANLDDLIYFLKNIDKSININVIGGGSNLLIRDGGIDGVIIVLKDNFKSICLKDNKIEVECGIINSKIFDFTKKNNIGGYEFLGTIPGTIGGAIRGNAGCNGSEIKDLLIDVDVIDVNGNTKTYKAEECNFEYRKNNLPNDLIFIKARLKASNKKDAQEIQKTYDEMLEKRKASQPIGVKTCGSTFKNPKEKPAWKVIQELGFQNKEIEGAKMSEKHANFMVNTGTATSKSLENLGEMIKKEALEKQNIQLEWEVKIIGKKI